MSKNLRIKILVVTLCSALGILFIQTLLFQNISATMIYEQSQRESYNSLENMSHELETFFTNMEANIIAIYNDKECLKDLGGEYNIDDMRLKYRHRARDLALDEFAVSDGVLALYLYNEEHQLISTYRKSMTPKRKYPKDIYEDEELYNSHIVKNYIESTENRMLVSGYNTNTSTQSIVRFVVKIHNINNLNQRIGYVVCDVDSKAIKNILNKYNVSDDAYIWIQAPNDAQIVTINNIAGENTAYYEEASMEVQNGKELPSSSQNDNHILFKVDIEKYVVSVYEIMSQNMLKQSQKLLTRSLVVTAGVLTIILTLVTMYLTRILTRPLENLTKTVTDIGKGHTELRAKYDSDDEIGQLSSEFNNMLDKIQELIGKEYESRMIIDKAQYQALQAQINPHFLYNTLDTMSSIAEIQDCDIVSQMCKSLSGIFRYSLDMKHPYSTVSKEINHLKNYIFVMNVRKPGEIEYRFDIDEEVLGDTLPRISIQPLVENAINHGLKNKHGDKYISIRAYIDGDELVLVVEDNGVGMDAAAVNDKLLKNDIGLIHEGNSIGIYNINARMKMLYGDEYGIHVESEIGNGTKVTIKIPRKTIEQV